MKTTVLLSPCCLVAILVGCTEFGPPAISLEAPTRERLWQTPYGSGAEIRSENYRIYTTATSREIKGMFPGFMEACHKNYLRLTHLSHRHPPELLPIYMLGTRDQWASLTTEITGDQAPQYLSIENGGYCFKDVCIFWQMSGVGTLMVAAHEGMHQFLHFRLKDQLPMWAEEGVCTLAEGYDVEGATVAFTPERNIARFNDLQGAIVKQFWVPIDRLLPMDAGDALGPYAERHTAYYGQLWALLSFLRSRPDYRAGLERMLADAAAGRFHETIGVPAEALAELRLRGKIYNQTVSEKLFRHYITDNLQRFEKEYLAFSMKLAQLE